MKRDVYDRRIEALLKRLDILQEEASRKSGLDAPVTAAMLQELTNTTEELQVADEELREANNGLVLSRQRYQELFDFAPDAYLVTNVDGVILQANHAAAQLLKTSVAELTNKLLTHYAPEGQRDTFHRLMIEAVRQKRIRDRDFELHVADDVIIPAACSIIALQDKDETVGLLWLVRDIRERRQAEAEVAVTLGRERRLRQQLEAAQQDLRLTGQRFRVALGSSPVTVFQQDIDLRYTWIHRTSPGFDANTFMGKTDDDLLSPADAHHLTSLKRAVLESGTGTRAEVAIQREDGQHFYDLTLEVLPDGSGRIIGITGAAFDVTERRRERDWLEKMKAQLEEAVAVRTLELQDANARLRRLTQQAVLNQEEERRIVSRELHDEAGQALTALKLSLDMIREELPEGSESLRCRIDEVISMAGKTLEDIRVLAHDLRPPALDNVDLDVALDGLCRDFGHLGRIQMDCAGMALPETNSAVKVCLYRFLQEALSNVARHAEAQNASVRWALQAGDLIVSVSDDGKGFDREAQLSGEVQGDGLGLMGMQERLKMLGGWLEIETEPGQGTRLVAHVPFKGDA